MNANIAFAATSNREPRESVALGAVRTSTWTPGGEAGEHEGVLTLDDADLCQANPRRGITLAPPKGGLDLLRSREDEIPFGLDEKEPKLVLPVKAALASGRAPVDLDAAAATILLLGEEERLPDDPKVDDINETILAWFGDPELALRALARHLRSACPRRPGRAT